jgi:hypothetical protein
MPIGIAEEEAQGPWGRNAGALGCNLYIYTVIFTDGTSPKRVNRDDCHRQNHGNRNIEGRGRVDEAEQQRR